MFLDERTLGILSLPTELLWHKATLRLVLLSRDMSNAKAHPVWKRTIFTATWETKFLWNT